MKARSLLLIPVTLLLACGLAAAESRVAVMPVTDDDGNTIASIVNGTLPLVHTAQFTSDDPLEALKAVEHAAGGGKQVRFAKLNVVAATQQAADAARAAIERHFEPMQRPPVSFVVGTLPRAGATVGFDGVAFVTNAAGDDQPQRAERFGAPTAILRAGPRIYVSGQAEKGESPAPAAAKTIASLLRTLTFAGARPADVVQAKCFLNPITSAAEVAAEFDKAFGKDAVPLVFVEWKSDLPIEIELIANGTAVAKDRSNIEFLTPPSMTASPVYSRVARINRGDLIYTAGLYARKPGDGEAQCVDLFEQLQSIASRTGTDLKHLAKATYYVSDADASAELNAVRPRYYDPQRPPAASKAMVSGTGMEKRSVTMDMIGVANRTVD